MKALIRGFLDAVLDQKKASVSGQEIIRLQRLVDALYESAAFRREVEVSQVSLQLPEVRNWYGACIYRVFQSPPWRRPGRLQETGRAGRGEGGWDSGYEDELVMPVG